MRSAPPGVARLVGPDHDTGLRQIDLDAAIRTVEHAQLRRAHMFAGGDRIRDPRD